MQAYKCPECGSLWEKYRGLALHIRRVHPEINTANQVYQKAINDRKKACLVQVVEPSTTPPEPPKPVCNDHLVKFTEPKRIRLKVRHPLTGLEHDLVYLDVVEIERLD